MNSAVELLLKSDDRLGECPLWDEREQALWWTDIHGSMIKRFDGALQAFPLPEPAGSFAFLEEGGLLVALRSGICTWKDKVLSTPLTPHGHPPDHRFNDGRCDRAGRFWVGTLNEPAFPATGRLYVFRENTFETKRTDICVPNSLAWSPDGRTMYFADSPRHTIWAFDYDLDAGTASNERIFATPHPGFPDGSCVDADGCLWNAEYGAARVVRYTPSGKVDRVIDVPAKEPTCCCFGGPRLDTLYITSANGGGVFALQPGVTGLPESRFFE